MEKLRKLSLNNNQILQISPLSLLCTFCFQDSVKLYCNRYEDEIWKAEVSSLKPPTDDAIICSCDGLINKDVIKVFILCKKIHYNTVHYNTVLYIVRFKDGFQILINDHKWSFFNIIYTFLFGYNTVV